MSIAARLQGRLDRLELSPEQAAHAAGLPAGLVRGLLEDGLPLPRGRRLSKLADVLETSVAYLIGLDPDAPVPDEYLQDDQGELGLLAADEDALLQAYRRLDISSRAAILRVLLKMAPEPEDPERRPVQLAPRAQR
jgi:transcriptional regulator with XRE-family HTH domain